MLWQLAEVEVQAGIEALEEAVDSGILREEEAGVGHPCSYRFAHDLIRDVVYTELGAARRQVLHQRALAVLETEGARAAELAYHALLAGEDESAYRYSVQAGDEALAVFAVEEAIGHYQQARALLQESQPLQTATGLGGRPPLRLTWGSLYLPECLGAGPGEHMKSCLPMRTKAAACAGQHDPQPPGDPGGPTVARQAQGAGAPGGSLAAWQRPVTINGRSRKRSATWPRS